MSNTPEGNICKVSANLGWASDTLGVLDKVLLKLSAEVKTILRERDNFQDQRDFCMGEIERLRKEIAECETCRHRMAVELLQVKNKSAVRQENHSLKVRLTAALNERDEARNIARWLYQHGMATLKEGAYRRPWVKEVIR